MRPRRVGPAGAARTMFICLLVCHGLLANRGTRRFEYCGAATPQLCSASSNGSEKDLSRVHGTPRRTDAAGGARLAARAVAPRS